MSGAVGLRFCISGLCFELLLPDGPVRDSLASAWRAFATSAPPAIEVEVDLSRGPRPPGPWTMTLPEPQPGPRGGLLLEHGDFSAEVTGDRSRAVVRGYAERYPVESLVKVLLADRLLGRGGLLVHGVAVARGGQAALFTGPSGAGKSTLGALCAEGGLELLADELVAVSPDGAGYRCEGTPWNVGRPGAARLASVGELAWADGAWVEPHGAVALLRLLLPNAVMADATPAGRARMFQAASALLRAVSPVRLSFARDVGVVAVLARALEGR